MIRELKRFNIIDYLQFQDLIVDIFNFRDNVNSYFIYGKHGQKQHSIDVYSIDTKTVIQCKYKRNKENTEINRNFIKSEIVKEINNVKLSKLKFNHFIYASTYDHDIEIQNFCIEYQEKYNLKFIVSYFGWNEIEKLILKNQNILEKYFHNLLVKHSSIELNKIHIDSLNCSWIKEEGYEFIFRDTPSEKNPFPIFDFYFFNNSTEIISLFDIKLKISFLPNEYHGLTGLPNEIFEINSYTKYEFIIENYQEYYKPKYFKPIGIPPNFPFSLQTQVINKGKDCYYELRGKYLFYFEFYFNNNVILKSPALYLNFKEEMFQIEEKVKSKDVFILS